MDVNLWLASAGAAAGLLLLVHWVVGGQQAARALLKASDLEPVARFSVYSTWHQVTLNIGSLVIAFGLASVSPELRVLAVFATALAGVVALWNLVLVIWKRQSPLAMPQWLLFGTVAGLGLAGLR